MPEKAKANELLLTLHSLTRNLILDTEPTVKSLGAPRPPDGILHLELNMD